MCHKQGRKALQLLELASQEKNKQHDEIERELVRTIEISKNSRRREATKRGRPGLIEIDSPFINPRAPTETGTSDISSKLSYQWASCSSTRLVVLALKAQTIRLQVSTPNVTHHELSASVASSPSSKIVVGTAWAGLVSGATRPFTGVLLGVYATCNGAGSGVECPNGGDTSYWQRWRYAGRGQEVAAGWWFDG